MFMLGSEFGDATPVVPKESDLQAAVARSSMPAVYTILTIWQSSPDMLDESGSISPRWTTSALMMAIEKARSDIVSLLLAVSNDDKLPVLDALRVGSIRNFEAFLWNGWDINEPVKIDGPPALGYAMHSKELVVWFLENGADPSAGYQYDTALSRAALSGTTEMIDMLLSHGGDVRKGDVLNWAVEREDDACEIAKLLLERGADPNRLRFDGQEPQWSVFGMRNGLGTPLHRAVILGRADLVTVLLAHGANPGVENTEGKTASQLAVESGETEMMELFDGFHT